MSKKNVLLLLCVSAGALEAGKNNFTSRSGRHQGGMNGPVSALFEQARQQAKNNQTTEISRFPKNETHQTCFVRYPQIHARPGITQGNIVDRPMQEQRSGFVLPAKKGYLPRKFGNFFSTLNFIAVAAGFNRGGNVR